MELSAKNQHITRLFQLAFLSLIAFELANYFGLLHFTLDFTWLGLVISSSVMLSGLLLTTHILRTKDTQLPWSVWALGFAFTCLDAGGDIFHLYNNFTWYDQLCHFLGGAAIAMMALIIIREVRQQHSLQNSDLLLGLGLTTILGNLYEIEEYTEDMINHTNRLGSGFDTANDLLMNLLGASMVIIFFCMCIKRRLEK